MFIWDIITALTNVMELTFSFLTGILSLLATIAALNERVLLFVIEVFQTAIDEVYNIGELLEKIITCRVSMKDFNHYGLETILETQHNICDLIFYWFRAFQQFLTPLPVGVSLAVAFAISSAIHRRKWIPYLKYFLPRRWQNRHPRNFIVGDTNDDSEEDWNANENQVLDYDLPEFREENSDGERDSSSNSDNEDVHSTFTDRTADHQSDSDSDNEHYFPFNRAPEAHIGSSWNSNVNKLQSEDKLLCVICQDKSKSVLVLPCRHLCMCTACAKVITINVELPKICPLCRTVISRLINVYV